MASAIPALFQPLTLRSITLRNRIGLSPMCMYSCENKDGVPDRDFLVSHLGTKAQGTGLVCTEATAVEADGRISLQCTGMWEEKHVEAWKPVVRFIKAQGAVPCMQLAHAGRKAGTRQPWIKDAKSSAYSKEELAKAYPPLNAVSSSAQPFNDGYQVPKELSKKEIGEIVNAWKLAADRAARAGFDAIELHFAHGYLAPQFYSPLVNKRTDEYGGSFENRIRFCMEVATACRSVFPSHLPILARINGSDWAPASVNAWTPEDAALLAKRLHEAGVDLVDVSAGSTVPNYIPSAAQLVNGYQVPFASVVKNKTAGTGLKVGTVGLITQPAFANKLLEDGHADMVMIGRAFLNDPLWALHAAKELCPSNTTEVWPKQFGWAVGPGSAVRKLNKL